MSEKKELELIVWDSYYCILESYMKVGKKIILSEYPFSDKQKGTLTKLTDKYGYEIITIRLIADFEILWERRYIRDRENDRHLSHIMTHYHFGDQLHNRSEADNHITKAEFYNIITERKYNDFELGKLYEFVVNDYKTVDYSKLLNELKTI